MPSKQVRYWRADGGYQDVPPPPPPPQVPQPMRMYWIQTPYGWQMSPYCQPQCPPGYSPYPTPQELPPAYQQCAPQRFVQGPIPIAGLCTPPPDYRKLSPPPPALPSPPMHEKKEEDGEEDDESEVVEIVEVKKKKKQHNEAAPPKLVKHGNYMYDKAHTMVHIFNKAAPVWTDKYRKEKLRFKMFKVSVNFTPRMIIENVLRTVDNSCKAWAVTEAIERGAGGWDKGSTVLYDSDKSKGTLKSMGWTKKRGDVLPPVWMVIHTIDFK